MSISAAEAADRSARVIFPLGGAYMFSPEVLSVGEEAGLDPFKFYVGGRGGVLGDVDPDVVISAFAFFDPAMIESQWVPATEIVPAREMGELYRAGIATWGRAHLEGVEGLEDFVGAAEALVEATQPFGTPMYAGWRNAERPSDAPAAAAVLLQILRELRFDVHVASVRSMGIGPLESVMAKEGADRAAMFGWSEPYPDGTAFSEQSAAADKITADRMTELFAQLSGPQRDALVTGVENIQASLNA